MHTRPARPGRHRAARRRRGLRRTGVVLGILALLMVGTGVGWAAWTATGSGAASARAVTATASVAVATTPGASLYPRPTAGYPSTTPGTIAFTLTNPNPYAVQFTALTVTAVTSADPVGCPSTNVTATASPVVVALSLPANAAATAQTVPAALSMATAAPNGCQGVTFTATVTLTGVSNPAG